MYIIVDCPKCWKYFIRRYGIKYTECPYCGARIRVRPERYLVFNSLEEARRRLAEMRTK